MYVLYNKNPDFATVLRKNNHQEVPKIIKIKDGEHGVFKPSRNCIEHFTS